VRGLGDEGDEGGQEEAVKGRVRRGKRGMRRGSDRKRTGLEDVCTEEKGEGV